MKRDMNLIRLLLLETELPSAPAHLVFVQKLIPIYSRKESVIPFGQDRVFE